jgi:hypothetical protein
MSSCTITDGTKSYSFEINDNIIKALKKRARAIAYFEDRDCDFTQMLSDIIEKGFKDIKPYPNRILDRINGSKVKIEPSKGVIGGPTKSAVRSTVDEELKKQDFNEWGVVGPELYYSNLYKRHEKGAPIPADWRVIESKKLSKIKKIKERLRKAVSPTMTIEEQKTVDDLEQIQKSFHLDIDSQDKMIAVLTGEYKTTPLEGEPAKITAGREEIKPNVHSRKRGRGKVSARSHKKNS